MSWSEVVRRARYTESGGFDNWWGFDHFQPMYGEGPGECFEAYTTLAALAGQTDSVRLGVLVTGVTYRHPSVLATELVTIDHASAGRAEFAVGSAWFEPEHRALGIDFPPLPERIRMLDEALTIIRGLMTTDSFSFDGEHWQLDKATIFPRPVQDPHVPVWVAAKGAHSIQVAAKHADVWHAPVPVGEAVALSATVTEAIDRFGRDPGSVRRAASVDLSQPFDGVRANVERLRAAGFDTVLFGWPSEGEAWLDQFIEQVLPEVAAD